MVAVCALRAAPGPLVFTAAPLHPLATAREAIVETNVYAVIFGSG